MRVCVVLFLAAWLAPATASQQQTCEVGTADSALLRLCNARP
jgi:hypothetical protein